MAEFCLWCWNRINGTEDNERKYILSKDLDLCEDCGEWKHVIVAERRFYYGVITLPFRLVYWIICGLLRLLILPYYKRSKNKY